MVSVESSLCKNLSEIWYNFDCHQNVFLIMFCIIDGHSLLLVSSKSQGLSEALKEETARFNSFKIFYLFETGEGYGMLACSDDGFVINTTSYTRFSAVESLHVLVRESSRAILAEKNTSGSFENISATSLLQVDSKSLYYMHFSYTTDINGYPMFVPWGTVVLEPVDCPVGYALDNATLICQKCAYPYSSTGGISECAVCEEGYYQINDKCISCPDNANCKAGTTLATIELKSGFWRWLDSADIVGCLVKEWCPGGNGTSSQNRESPYCAPDTTGPFCALCEEGYLRTSEVGMCERCAGDADQFLENRPWIIPAVVVLFFLCLCLPYMVAAVYMYAHEADVIFSNMMDDKPHGVMKRLSNKAKIVFVCLQIVFQCIVGLDVEYPKEVINVSKDFSDFFALSPAQIFPVNCLTDPTNNAYWYELQTVTIFPVIVILVIVLYSLIRIGCANYKTDKETHRRRMLAMIVGIAFIILPSTSSVVLNTFNAEYTNGDDINYAYLAVDYSTKINSRAYQYVMRPYALICILIYPIGIPTFFLVLLRANSAKVDPILARPRKLEDADDSLPDIGHGRQYVDSSHMMEAVDIRDKDMDIAHLGFLINTYEPQFWYWEIVVSVYRILITNIHILNEKYAVILVFLCALSYWKLVSYYAPFTYDWDDFLADLCQGIVVLTLLMGIVIQNFGCPAYYTTVFVIMIVVVVFFIIANILMDTVEERGFVWMHRREIAKSLMETPKAVAETRRKQRIDKALGYDESDL